jgi:CPA1 family monovalent cation:H+ antiporter
VHGPGDALGVLALVAAAAAVAGLARRLNWSAPLLAVLAGLVASLLPGVPTVRIEPDIVLTLILPPLLFSAALDSSYLNFRRNLRPIGLLSVGLVLFTALVLGGVMYAVVPALTLPAAITLGAIVAPPDAVASTAIGRRIGLPRRLVVILAGESLVNDATALTAYRVAVAAAVGTGFSFVSATGVFVVAAAGGVLIGVAVAWVVNRLVARLTDPVVENTLMLLAPFIAFTLAEAVDASGVLAVVVAGLLIGHTLPKVATYASRLQAAALWKMIDFLLESVVFMLIGLQLPTVLLGLHAWSIAQLAGWAALATAVVIVARYVWVFPATYLPVLLSRRVRERDPAPPWQVPVVVGWAGMRGVVSIAAAYALPVTFPGRDLVTFLTFCVVIATLVLHGLTLPAVIRRLGVVAEEERRADNLAEAGAQHSAINAAIGRLDELLAEDGDVPKEIVHRLRDRAEVRSLAAWERLGGSPDDSLRETPTAAYRRLRRDMLKAERAVFVRLRDEGRIDDEVLRRVQLELDLEEALMSRD